ncbi:MAG TPA: sugar-binding protein [Planctomycetota bacterium]|nr:sugar-binding protein [Planctomycetota bacterium]
MTTRALSAALFGLFLASPPRAAHADDGLPAGVRGVATRAPAGMKIDGDLSEFREAFATPVEYFHPDLRNRASQFFYMWDADAFYAGLRTLDEKQANIAPDDRLWEGDAVEWYFDTRRDAGFRGQSWGPGAVHCYWTGYKDREVQGRFCLRPGFLDAIPKTGVEVAARRTRHGAEVEFKLPWVNFPGFKPEPNTVIGLDAELCYSDGAGRTFRTFVYGSPLSVEQPASLAKVALVEKLEPRHWKHCGPVLMPLRCDTAWSQPGKSPVVTAQIALPPNHASLVGKVLFRLVSLDGGALGEHEGKRETIEEEGSFARMTATWPIDAAPPGGYHVLAVILDREGKELSRVAPRLVSVNMSPGY